MKNVLKLGFEIQRVLMKLNQNLNLFFCFLLFISFSSCGPSSSNDQSNAEEFRAAEDALENEIEDLVYNIPSPTEIPYLLQATGAEYNASLLNPRSRSDQYATSNEKTAVNLGVYTADVGYLASYDKTQEAIDYLNTCRSLGQNIDVIGSFDIQLLERFEANIANKDSLARLLDESVKNTEAFLQGEDRRRLAALVIAGSFVEGLYISTGLVKSYPKDILPDDARNLVLTPLIQVILQQEKSVSELRRMLEPLDATELVTSLRSNLEQLEETYSTLNIEDQIRNNRADLVLSDQNLGQISTIVERMRQTITQ